MTAKTFLLALLTIANATHAKFVARDDCKPCAPEGATGTDIPDIGSDLKSMYIDLLDSVKGIHFKKREAKSVVRGDAGFCCQLDCVNLHNFNVPMCYDKFTTQYAFPDGSYGSLTTGNYTQDGTVVNLITGNYTKPGGEIGDIYSADPGARPNTATLSIPPQWTEPGVGSAIPATKLGSVIPQTSTGSSSNSTQTNAATTVAAVPSSKTAAATSSSSTAAAGHIGIDSSVSFGMSVISALMYAIYAL